jgi:hypothetical protein
VVEDLGAGNAPEDIEAETEAGGAGDQAASGQMWFEDPEMMCYWVDEGQRALEELGSTVEHGLAW